MITRIFKSLFSEDLKWRVKTKLGVPSQKSSLQRVKSLGFAPKTCIDIGAYVGNWTIEFKATFPKCDVLMIEGQQDKEAALLNVKSKYAGSDFLFVKQNSPLRSDKRWI